MAGKTITHAELDDRLDRLARKPDSFTRAAGRLAANLDARGLGLEITDPSTWRTAPNPARENARVTIDNQLRTEIDSLHTMGREQEVRLARRIEFARIRMGRVLRKAGLTPDDLVGGLPHAPSTWLGNVSGDCALPPEVCRRWCELHALRTEMVERNLYLVLINVERYAHTTVGRPDLIQEGAASLFRAVDGFDWRRGLLFRTYAVHWLNQAFRSYLYNFGHTVRVPVYLQKATKHIHSAMARLGDRRAGVDAIARESGLGENIVATALSAARSTRSLDSPIGDAEDGLNLRDVLSLHTEEGPYTPDIEDVSLHAGLSEALGRLSDRERYVVGMRFGIGGERAHTLAEVADELGVSLERVRQIQVRAISKLRTSKLRKVVDPFLNN